MNNTLVLVLVFFLIIAGFVAKMTGKYPALWDVAIFITLIFLLFTPLL